MDETMNTGMIVEFAVTTLGVIAIIAVLSLLTPWLAKHVDNWIAKYRNNHSAKRDSIYAVRSIYDIPPEAKKAAEQAEISNDGEAPEEQ